MKFKLPPRIKPSVAEIVGTAFDDLEACGLIIQAGPLELKPGELPCLHLKMVATSADLVAAVLAYVSPGTVTMGVPK